MVKKRTTKKVKEIKRGRSTSSRKEPPKQPARKENDDADEWDDHVGAGGGKSNENNKQVTVTPAKGDELPRTNNDDDDDDEEEEVSEENRKLDDADQKLDRDEEITSTTISMITSAEEEDVSKFNWSNYDRMKREEATARKWQKTMVKTSVNRVVWPRMKFLVKPEVQLELNGNVARVVLEDLGVRAQDKKAFWEETSHSVVAGLNIKRNNIVKDMKLRLDRELKKGTRIVSV